MFVQVKYGDSKDFLVNIDCRTPDLLNYVRQRLEIEPYDVIDLVDDEGALKQIHAAPPDSFASSALSPRFTYVPVLLQQVDNLLKPVKVFINDEAYATKLMELMIAAADADALSDASSAMGTSRREKGKGGKGGGKGGGAGATRKGKDGKSKERQPAQSNGVGVGGGQRAASPGSGSTLSASSNAGGGGTQEQFRGDSLQPALGTSSPRASPASSSPSTAVGSGGSKRNSPLGAN